MEFLNQSFFLRHNSHYASRISTPVGMICLKHGVDAPEFAVIARGVSAKEAGLIGLVD
jgi:hypothetical protein